MNQVRESAVKEVVSEAHYAYPPEKVWELLNHFIAFPKFIPRLKDCDMLGRIDDKEQVYFLFDLPFPMPDLWNIISLARFEPIHRFEWKMLKGNMKENEGSFQVDGERGGSVVHLRVHANPGHLLPKWLVSWGAKNFIPKVLKSIGDRLGQPLPEGTPTPGPEKK